MRLLFGLQLQANAEIAGQTFLHLRPAEGRLFAYALLARVIDGLVHLACHVQHLLVGPVVQLVQGARLEHVFTAFGCFVLARESGGVCGPVMVTLYGC